LTKDQDRLIAISGVVKRVQKTLRDDYLAGIWKRQLPYGLLWKVDPEENANLLVTTSNYCAPSWSWASLSNFLMGSHEITTHQRPNLVEILEVCIVPLTQDAMGQVSSAFLRLQGWLKSFDLSKKRSEVVNFPNWSSEYCSAFFDEDVYNRAGFWCLPMVEQEKSPLEGGDGDAKIFGLILSKTGVQDQYRRRGQFEAWGGNCEYFRRPAYPNKQHESIKVTFEKLRTQSNLMSENIDAADVVAKEAHEEEAGRVKIVEEKRASGNESIGHDGWIERTIIII
jgi:hypothetical protein